MDCVLTILYTSSMLLLAISPPGYIYDILFFFFSSRRRHTRSLCDWSSDVCSSDLELHPAGHVRARAATQWEERVPGRPRRGAYPHPPRADDGSRDDRRHVADGDRRPR